MQHTLILISDHSPSFKSNGHSGFALMVYIHAIHASALRRSSEKSAFYRVVQYYSQPLHSLTYVQANLIKGRRSIKLCCLRKINYLSTFRINN